MPKKFAKKVPLSPPSRKFVKKSSFVKKVVKKSVKKVSAKPTGPKPVGLKEATVKPKPCIACMGIGVSTSGFKCTPCLGTGYDLHNLVYQVQLAQ